MDAVNVWGALIGLMLLLVLPGLSWSYLLIHGTSMGWPSRLLVSIGLSLVIMPLAAFWLNLAAGVPVTMVSLVLIACTVSFAPVSYLAWKRWARP